MVFSTAPTIFIYPDPNLGVVRCNGPKHRQVFQDIVNITGFIHIRHL